MLISKQSVSNGDIVSLRLVSGDELVGKMTDLTPDAVTLSRPILIMAQMGPGGQVGLQFAPFVFSADEDGPFVISRDKLIAAPLKTRKDVANNYIQATTGLAMPASGASSILKP